MKLLFNQVTKLFSAILLALLLVTSASFAQLKEVNLRQYTELDGVPGAEVLSVLADKFGYIWVGTRNGLARYDGYEFKKFIDNINDPASVHGLIVMSLFEDSRGYIWVGNQGSWLNRYDPATRTFRQYSFKNIIDHPANVELDVISMAEDNQGRIFFGVSGYNGESISQGLLYIDEKDDSVRRYDSADKQAISNVYSITKDKEGYIWFLSYNGLFKIDAHKQLHPIHSLDEDFKKNKDSPADMKFDNQGHLWMITGRLRLYDINLRDSSVISYSPPISEGNYGIRLAIDKNENIWIGTRYGITRFVKNTKKFENFQNVVRNQLEKTYASVSSLTFDAFGSLWVGTQAQGLLKYEERAIFKSYTSTNDPKNPVTPGWVDNICESHDKKIWFVTSQLSVIGGINTLDPLTGVIRTIPYRTLVPGLVQINGFREDIPGEWILSTYTGNYRYFSKTGEIKKIVLNGLPDHSRIKKFLTDSKGNEWLCTYNGLYKKDKGSDLFRRYDLSTIPGGDVASNSVNGAFESKAHGLWVFTYNGLFLYNYLTDKIERHGYDIKTGDIFIAQIINSFYETPDGTAWVGAWTGGLSQYNVETKKIKIFTRDDGLPSMSIQSIIGDEKNNSLWLSTFDGLSRFDIKTGQFNNFSISDGIQGQQFADGSFLKTSEGLFAFGGSNGITTFNPNEITKNSAPPKVFLTDFKLFNKSVLPGEKSVLKKPIYDTKEISLGHDQNNVSIEFVAIHFTDPIKNKYAYKLENYDNDWREVGSQHTAFYPNLPSGRYLFHVKAANSNGVWNETGASVAMVISPPWWETTFAYIFYGLLLIAGIFGADRYFRTRIVRRERLRNQARELVQAKEIEKAYTELKATQAQLIQSEKMASLGELTAGIAHEIQNPLNFVNNFSDVNSELIDEMQQEMDNGNLADAKAISNNIKENEQKINHHGKRADAIVKGMLQHSRSSSGVKEPTDINALADEYLRLSYHGLRAKDKSFNATMKTDFDESIGNISIIPQDIGRVILNLITNAFYAVDEKKKQDGKSFEPIVSISSKKIGDKVFLSVKDNGNGIPQNVLGKIFQPFFTTKPSGQGTGLGLSMSYDIVKVHGGELKVDTIEGVGSTFIIGLPVII